MSAMVPPARRSFDPAGGDAVTAQFYSQRCARCDRLFERPASEIWRTMCPACFARARQAPERAADVEQLRTEMRYHMRGLLTLCDPARHNRRRLAIDTWRWLERVRARLNVDHEQRRAHGPH